MSQAKGKAVASKKAAAARAETNGKPPTVSYRGLELVLPPQLSSEVAYAYAELEGRRGIKPIVDFVASLIGAEQMALVREKQAADGVRFDEVPGELDDLVGSVFEAYGTTAGESSASPKS